MNRPLQSLLFCLCVAAASWGSNTVLAQQFCSPENSKSHMAPLAQRHWKMCDFNSPVSRTVGHVSRPHPTMPGSGCSSMHGPGVSDPLRMDMIQQAYLAYVQQASLRQAYQLYSQQYYLQQYHLQQYYLQQSYQQRQKIPVQPIEQPFAQQPFAQPVSLQTPVTYRSQVSQPLKPAARKTVPLETAILLTASLERALEKQPCASEKAVGLHNPVPATVEQSAASPSSSSSTPTPTPDRLERQEKNQTPSPPPTTGTSCESSNQSSVVKLELLPLLGLLGLALLSGVLCLVMDRWTDVFKSV